MATLWVEDNVQETGKKYGLEEAIITRSLEETFYYLDKHFNRIDCVVLDIDLAIGEQIETVERYLKKVMPIRKAYELVQSSNLSVLKEQAGLYLFLYLLYKGFPRDRICFLTGNQHSLSNPVEELIDFIDEYGLHEFKNYEEVANNREVHEKEWHTILPDEAALKAELERYIDEIDPVNEELANELFDLFKVGDFYAANQLLLTYLCNAPADEGPNTYDRFKYVFEELIGIRAPISFRKDDPAEQKKINNWLKKKATPYYQLRDGIIEISTYIVKQLEDKGEVVEKFRSMYAFIDESRKKVYTTDYFKELMHTMQTALPLREPEEKNALYKHMLKSLSHPLEAIKFSLSKRDLEQRRYSPSDTLLHKRNEAYFQIMKLLRNWVAHSKLTPLGANQNLTEKEVAFFFLIAVHSYFLFEQNEHIISEQQKLLTLLGEKAEYEEVKKKLSSRTVGIAEDFEELKRQMPFSKSLSFHSLLEEAGKGNRVQCTSQYLIKLLWHALYDVSLDIEHSNSLKLTFNSRNISSILQNPNDALSQTLLHTYRYIGRQKVLQS